MQTKAILAVLLLCVFAAGARQKNERRWYKKKEAAAWQTGSSDSGRINYHVIGAPLPPLRLVDSAGIEYTNASLQNGANLFVMMFNPTCEHCESMAVNMSRNIKLFKKSNIVLVAGSMMKPYLSYFYNNTHCGEAPQIKVTIDSCDFINKCFNYGSLPQINVYNPERRLIKIFAGIETIDSLKPFIQ